MRDGQSEPSNVSTQSDLTWTVRWIFDVALTLSAVQPPSAQETTIGLAGPGGYNNSMNQEFMSVIAGSNHPVSIFAKKGSKGECSVWQFLVSLAMPVLSTVSTVSESDEDRG